jgi:hypothetical protein
MNGDIARWLRLLGYDCVYCIDDGEALKEAEAGRVLVTRDRALLEVAKARGLKAIDAGSGPIHEKLAELHRAGLIELRVNLSATRCPRCNGELTVSRRGSRKIWHCMECGKEYWIGGHWRNIAKVIKLARRCAGLTI